jgi:hypothetical protein
LYYHSARYYNSRWSTWLSFDSLEILYLGHALYNYVLNSPIKFTDPHSGIKIKGEVETELGLTRKDKIDTSHTIIQTFSTLGTNLGGQINQFKNFIKQIFKSFG